MVHAEALSTLPPVAGATAATNALDAINHRKNPRRFINSLQPQSREKM